MIFEEQFRFSTRHARALTLRTRVQSAFSHFRPYKCTHFGLWTLPQKMGHGSFDEKGRSFRASFRGHLISWGDFIAPREHALWMKIEIGNKRIDWQLHSSPISSVGLNATVGVKRWNSSIESIQERFLSFFRRVSQFLTVIKHTIRPRSYPKDAMNENAGMSAIVTKNVGREKRRRGGTGNAYETVIRHGFHVGAAKCIINCRFPDSRWKKYT